MKKKFTFLMAALMLLTMINLPGKAVGQTPLLTSDLDWGTPVLSENFDDLNEVTNTGNQTSNSTTTISNLTAYGIFNKISIGKKAAHEYAIVDDDDFDSNIYKLTSKGTSFFIASITGHSSDFGSTGAYSIKVGKADYGFFGLYATDDGNGMSHANASVFIRINNGALHISDGGATSTKWISIGTYTSDIISINVVYNNTSANASYGDGITLNAKTAHIFVNGECVMNGANPKNFTIPGASLTVFRCYPNNTNNSVFRMDDVMIYNTLPTAASSDPTITVSPTSLDGFTYSHGNGPSEAQSFTVSGTNLTANISITAPTDYEIRQGTTGDFGNSISLTPSNGTVSSTTIYARLKSGLAIGNYNSENVSLTSTNATTKTVALSGNVTGYTVTYDGNGETSGEVPTDGTSYTYNATVTVKSNSGNLAKDHYNFSGWNTQPDGNGTNYTAGTGTFNITANTTLYAKWTPITHTFSTAVTPNNSGTVVAKDGGDNTIASGSSVAETAQLTLTAYPAEGYNFTSWSDGSTNATLSSTADNPTTFTMGTANVTITATFTARTPATVTLYDGLNGETTTVVNTYTDATLADVIEGHDIASVNGWTALGWVKSYTSGTPTLITTSEAVGSTTKLYALYKKGSNTFSRITSTNDLAVDGVYMICYNSSTTYKFMNDVSSNFMGYTDANSVSNNSFEYAAGKKFTLGGSTGAYTLYDGSKYLTATSDQQYLGLAEGGTNDVAKWTITFDNNNAKIKNNGLTGDNIYVSYYASKNYFNMYQSYNTIYLFKQITNNLQYSITPSAEKCHVTYDANGATSGDVPVDNNEYEPSDVVTVLGNNGNLAKTGHTWNGWNTDAEGNGDSYNADGEFTITANTTLYAQWTINEYSYTLIVDDNSEAELEVDGSPVAANAKIQYNKEVTVNVDVTDGYTYHISVINEATSEAVTVTNDKFTMPASSVTVTVTTEENPFATVTLTSANMTGMSGDLGYGNVKSVTVGGYYWETNGQQVTDRNYIQIRARLGNNEISYVKLPSFNGKIETITMSVTNGNDGNWSQTVFFNDAVTNNNSDYIVIATGSSVKSITLDLSGKFYSTGYVLASGTTRIYQIDVVYRPYKNMTGTELSTIDADRTVSIPANTNATATNLTIPASSGIFIKSGATLTVSGTLTNGGNANNIVIEDGGQLVIANAVNATLQKGITGYGDNTAVTTGWYTIASPVVGTDMSLSAVGDYDLFKYDEENHKWLNEYNHEDDFTSTSVAEGFLYANGENQTLPFAGEMKASNAEVTKALTYSSTDGKLIGFNLVGNPFTCNLTSSMVKMNGETLTTYYVSEGNANLKTRQLSETPIKPGQGFFVQAPAACNLVFNETPAGKGVMDYKPTFISLEAGNTEFTDNAYIQLGYGNTLRKMSINDNTSLVYVMNEGADYAAATVDELKGSMPICFKAAATGQYTISVNTEGLDMSYLHLIDRFTGEDVNMLLEPTYSFIATKGDNESRFILSFTANCFNDSESETFAYQVGNDIFVSGEGELQIFDVTGRLVSTTNVNGVETINVSSSGIYIFRLVGTEVKTQKIVVR